MLVMLKKGYVEEGVRSQPQASLCALQTIDNKMAPRTPTVEVQLLS